ncbi:MAG: cupin [Alphaproteobacteria bacterium]|nr:cupin [Alphaproteobacteria bacterium]
MAAATAQDIIERLSLARHPEGGWYRETFRDKAASGAGMARGASTAIYYLLEAGERSHWHRIDAAEVWHFYAGGPLALTISPNGHDVEAIRLGPNVLAGDHPQAIVRPGAWQTAEPLGAWTLVGCTVAPAFDFAHFELAPDDWRPSPRGA